MQPRGDNVTHLVRIDCWRSREWLGLGFIDFVCPKVSPMSNIEGHSPTPYVLAAARRPEWQSVLISIIGTASVTGAVLSCVRLVTTTSILTWRPRMQSETHSKDYRVRLWAASARRPSAPSTLICLALAACAHMATAASLSSNLTEQGTVANQGQQFVQLFNGRDMAPDEHVELSFQGDEALSVLSLQGSNGIMTLSEHACSGPPIGSSAGRGNASGVLNYEEHFTISSTTLSAGTPVTIAVRLASATKARAALSYPDPARPPSTDLADVSGHVGIRIDAEQLSAASFQGDISAMESGQHAPSQTSTGILVGGTFAATVIGRVGQSFGIAIQSSLSASSRSIIGNTSDADSQIALVWGAEVVGGVAELKGDDGFLFPSLGGVTGERALANLPPPPTDLPEPSSMLMFAVGLVGLAGAQKRRVTLWLRRPTFARAGANSDPGR